MELYTITGTLAKDCETATTTSSKQVIKFSIPIDQSWKDKDGVKHEKTKWINCVWWNDNTVISQYLKKGLCVSIVGEPVATAYNDKDGKAVAKLECRVLSLKFNGQIKTKDDSTPHPAPHSVQTNEEFEQKQFTDDLPF